VSRTSAWTIEGSEGLPIHGNTHVPEGTPLGHALVVHGWTGCKDRNIVPAITHALRSSCVVHRCTLSHAGIGKDGQDITRPDEFERDSLAFCVEDIRRVVEHIAPSVRPPFVLIGHSRAGATVMRCAVKALEEGWPARPDGVVSLAGTATYTRFDDTMRAELEEKGCVERECGRAPGGVVRMGPSWYEHHLEEPERDLFAEDCARVACPVLIVHGDADDSVPIDHAHRTGALLGAGACPSVEVVEVKGADHNFGAGGAGFDRENIATPQTEVASDAITRFIGRL